MSRKPQNISLQRAQLDKRLTPLRKANLSSPPTGWIRTIRTALGMTATQLAKRLNVTPQTITDYEAAEEKGSISVTTLRKIAEALGCEAQLMFLPRTSLEAMIKEQALKAAAKIVGHADVQMKLEDQGTSKKFREKQIKELAEEIARNMSRELWEA